MLSFPAKLVDERRFASMDFTAQLANIGSGVTISASPAPTVSAASYSGTPDPSPSAILDGSPTLSNSIVGQWLKAGVVGATYVLTWTVTFSDGSVVERQRVLPVVDRS